MHPTNNFRQFEKEKGKEGGRIRGGEGEGEKKERRLKRNKRRKGVLEKDMTMGRRKERKGGRNGEEEGKERRR